MPEHARGVWLLCWPQVRHGRVSRDKEILKRLMRTKTEREPDLRGVGEGGRGTCAYLCTLVHPHVTTCARTVRVPLECPSRVFPVQGGCVDLATRRMPLVVCYVVVVLPPRSQRSASSATRLSWRRSRRRGA